MSTAAAVTLVGATGLTGSAALQSFLSSTRPYAITTLTRKPLSFTPSNPASSYSGKTFSDLFDAIKTDIAQPGGVYVSCLGTTRRIAGGVENQRKIDVDLNRDLARKAKEDGASVMILVSSTGADASSYFAYPKMKGELEEEVKAMGFDHCVLLRPAWLIGAKDTMPMGERGAQSVMRGLRGVGVPLDFMSVDGKHVGQCIAYLAGHPPADKVTILNNGEIIALAKKWREENGQA